MKVRSVAVSAVLIALVVSAFWAGRLIQANEDAQDQTPLTSVEKPDERDALYALEVCSQSNGENIRACFDWWYLGVYEALSEDEEAMPSVYDDIRQWCNQQFNDAQDVSECIIRHIE